MTDHSGKETSGRCSIKPDETQIGKGNQCPSSSYPDVFFSARKINLSIQRDLETRTELADLGHLIEAENGLFSADIVFETTPPTPGFVVQYIKKDLTVTVPGGTTDTSLSYWEIFYISKEGWAINPDGFVQKPCEMSSGEACQLGVAYFYPYSGDVPFTGTTMQKSTGLRKIFGPHVKFDFDRGRVRYAGGLPSCTATRPIMTGLCAVPCSLTHVVRFSWSSDEMPARTKVKERMWRTCENSRSEIDLERPPPFIDWQIDSLRTLWNKVYPRRAPAEHAQMASDLTNACSRIDHRSNFTSKKNNEGRFFEFFR